MKKKIYAVKKGYKQGIYSIWKEAEKQINGFSGAEFRGFTYSTEKEKEDETVEGSLAYARKQAIEYIKKEPDLKTECRVEKAEGTRIKSNMAILVMRASAIRIALQEQVIGQDDVIDKIERAYFHAEKMQHTEDKKKGPANAYLFAGPSGVGKTFVAEIIAGTLGIRCKRFDMSGYSDSNTVTELMGSSTLYKDSKPGVLTDFVREHPRCVLLFDEIEKACAEVILLFLQILDEGKCFDRHYEKDIDFRKVIIIFTTNAGKQLYQDAVNENLTLLPDTVVIDALKKDRAAGTNLPFFPPEIISRMSSHTIVMFNHLRKDAILKIIKGDLDKQLKPLKETYGYEIECEKEKIAATALYSMGGSMDARNAAVLAGKLIDRGLYEFLSLAEEKMGFELNGGIRKIIWEHDFSGATDEIRQFYFGEKDCVIAVFGQTKEIYDRRLKENNVQIKAAADPEEFMRIIRREHVILAAIDYAYGMKKKENDLSIADIRTEGSNVFSDIRKEYGDIPVYILQENKSYHYSKREEQALRRRGAAGFIKQENMQTEIYEAYADTCFGKTMETLSLRHQRLTFEIRNKLEEKQKAGRIIFCNFKLESAVESEDKELLLSADMRPDKHWNDIIISSNVKNELEYFINFLKKPKEYLQKGVRVPRGVLMYGPAGTGKTSLAKVVASESGVSFLEISADVLVNRGADEVHRIFRAARKYAPAVLFIDEADAVGKARTQAAGSTNIILNALLTEMDGFRKVDDKPVFIMAATNMDERMLDRAFLRRFDRKLFINIPGAEGRKKMLERLICGHKDMFHVSNREINSIVTRSSLMSFADLENVIEMAMREAVRADKKVDDRLLNDIFEEFKFGEEMNVDPFVREKTAYHEAGHALVQLYHKKLPRYMSIVARGNFVGYVLPGANPNVYDTKESLLQKISEMLGGRAAEMVQGYSLTPGASSDLKQATNLAVKMVCCFGMYEKEVGLASISERELLCNEKAKTMINRILSEQLQEAVTIMKEKKDALEHLVKAVMDSEKQYLTKEEIEAVYKGGSGS